MATLSENNRAASDPRLLRRIIGAAHAERIPNAQSWAEMNVAEIVTTTVTVFGSSTTLADLHTFAVASFEIGKHPEPGDDANKNADEAFYAAVQAVHARQTA